MFLEFFYALRAEGIPVAIQEWMMLMKALKIGQDVHPKIVSERLGHATIAITLDTYSHVMPGMQEDAALRLDAVLQVAINARNGNK